MNWDRIKCALLGHNLARVLKPGYMEFGIAAPCKCIRCGFEWEGIKYPPRLPAPPAPPARKDVITIKLELDGLEEAKAELARFHEQLTEVLAMRDAVRQEPAGDPGLARSDEERSDK